MSLFYTFHFYLFGVMAIAAALVFVTRKSPVAAAMWLVTTMFCLAALYIMLGAEFIEPGCGACIAAGPGTSARPDEVTV
jgi:NADH:ubiquinone oxidoreductase subunit 6 (subunit J)